MLSFHIPREGNIFAKIGVDEEEFGAPGKANCNAGVPTMKNRRTRLSLNYSVNRIRTIKQT